MLRIYLLIVGSGAGLMGQAPAGTAVDSGIRKGLEATVWVNNPKPGQLPAGVSHHTYFSASMKHDVGYCIYLPPDYASANTARYPVIYNLHGAGGDELHGFEEARLLDGGIRSGKLPQMILVMPNGGKSTMYKDSYDGKYMGETNIIRELIPHIDQSYRTIAAREGRCIEGFSMGGRGSTRLALKYPDLFCSLFNQAGNVMHIADLYDPTHPAVYPNFYLGPDKSRYVDNDPFLLLAKNLDRIKGRLRIQVWCGTKDDGHLPSVREFHQALTKAGVDHTYMEIEGLAHKHNEMLSRYQAIWFDYHVESLRRAGLAQAPLGSVAESAQACPAGPMEHTVCRRLQVSCQGMKPIEVQIRITEPAAGVSLRGTVVLGSGGGGGGFYAGGADGQTLVKDIAAMGFRVVDRAWNGGWTTHEGGLRKESCRYATLLTWIHDTLHKGGKFVATGNSGGSAEIGYALTTWRRGDILDLAIPTSGPPIARLDYACVKEASPEWSALCKSIVPAGKMECASGCILGTSNDVCKQFSPDPTLAELREDSVVHPQAVLNYPKTRVHFLYGARDCGEPVPVGLTFATRVTSEKVIEFVPKTPHGMASTPEGREAIRKAIDVGTATAP